MANYKLQNDIKFISEMYRSLNSDHNEVIDKWSETVDRWNETLDTCNEINDLNGKLFDKSKEIENRIFVLEKAILHDTIDHQKICPSTEGPCAVEEE